MVRHVVICIVNLAMITGCASHHADSDSNNYRGADGGPPRRTEGAGVNPPFYSTSATGMAVLYGVATGVALATNPDYYKANAITGRCFCRGKEAGAMELPCSNIELVLVDNKGHEVSRLQSHDGTFAFVVKRNQPFRVRAMAAKFQSVEEMSRPVQVGDDIVVRLVHK